MYNLHLSAEQLEIRDMVRDFVTHEVKPVALKMERLDVNDRSLLVDALDKASQLGLRTLALSEELGGAGADALTCCIVTEELAAGDADIAAVLTETARLAHALFDRMTAEQRACFLPAFLADDRHHLACADHEPGTETALGVNYHRPLAGSDAIKTTAVSAANGDWVVNGVKDCVANAPVAKLFAVEVVIGAQDAHGHGQQASTLLIPRDAPGLTVRAYDEANRWYHGACGELIFEDCRIPAANLLEADNASPSAGGTRRETLLAALNLGIGRAGYEAALDYAQLRIQGGRHIIEHQAIGTKLAEIAISLTLARNLVWQAAWAADHPEARADRSLPDLPLATMARVFTSEAMFAAAKEAAEVFGAMGVMRDMPLQKYVRDARICLQSGDGNADAKLRIAEALAGYRRPAPSMLAAE
jgi:alkylation response protein AidB-like acyl-CoA dehydrogenase